MLSGMGSELTGAIVGLMGGGFGAGAAMWGSITAARTQLRLNQTQLEAAALSEEAKVTRAIYADFLRAGVQFELAWRTLLISLREGVSTAEDRDRLYGRVITFEHDRWTSYSILLLEAPEPVATLATELTNAYVDLDTIAEKTRERLTAAKDSRVVMRWPEFNAAATECGKLTARFAQEVKAMRDASRLPASIQQPHRARILRRPARLRAAEGTVATPE
ncbi:MAG: hypothetical protein JF587_02220 [Catenulisporales bacterium]|nr:hypothetical protein [Catenulisporales bacterium]